MYVLANVFLSCYIRSCRVVFILYKTRNGIEKDP